MPQHHTTHKQQDNATVVPPYATLAMALELITVYRAALHFNSMLEAALLLVHLVTILLLHIFASLAHLLVLLVSFQVATAQSAQLVCIFS